LPSTRVAAGRVAPQHGARIAWGGVGDTMGRGEGEGGAGSGWGTGNGHRVSFGTAKFTTGAASRRKGAEKGCGYDQPPLQVAS
jgi:hypothetical protein